MVGRTIGKYRIVEQIGRGGMGTVYKAIDDTLDRRVAIKILNADLIDQEAVERFRREALTLAKLNHGRIGAIHELARDGHDLLMVMEYLEGETVEKLIERGPMTIPRAVTLCSQVLDALQYAHGAGVVHRDLKPANVMVTPSGDIKVMDFGIARVQGSEHLTTNGYMVGTPAYMAPEQVRGEEVDPRMDLYAAAVVLYRMLTQRLPFQGDTAIAMIHSQLTNPPTPPRQFRADLPDWIVGVITKGLSKAPADRFQTAAEFRAALETGLTGRMPFVTAPGDAETLPPTLTPPSMRAPVAAPSATASAPASASAPMSASGVGPAPVGTATRPAPFPPPAAHPEATVTLRAPHLATAGGLLVLLVVGIAVLAYIAIRRPVVVAPPAQSTEARPAAVPPGTETPPATTAAAPAAAATPAPAAAVTPAQPVSAPPAASTPPVTAAPPAPPKPSAPAGTAPATMPRPGATATSTRPADGRGSASATLPGAAARGAGRGAKDEAPVAAAANAPAENFGDIKTMMVDGGKGREVDALLSLEPGTLMVRARNDGALLRTLPYTQIAAATYVRARRPRGQIVPGLVEVPANLGGGVFGGSRHWLTLQTATDYLIIRLEDRNVIRVLSALEARTGSKISRGQSE